jgi:hypothetical protein
MRRVTESKKDQEYFDKKYYRRMRRQFPGVHGKIVDYVSVERGDDGFDIHIEFMDKTALLFDCRPQLGIEPELTNWKTGNGKRIKRYPALTTRS